MKDLSPPLEADLLPVSRSATGSVFAATGLLGDDPVPVVFATLADGAPCVYIGMRATPKTT
ncbi:hypothetical protein [Sphaerisporangium sp. TRM90804]|uniref:hypothetical protein n=1 Tax=Sphaerisporangium sp. TRM90804 TaxID=3031113 RepID=UPI002446C7F2|nr:hypothetical protein [Sphaerisporangium sp. TRM90804]MDH2430642.1 hypothetical protein [Sphaerisporangium sp. TRM90804]